MTVTVNKNTDIEQKSSSPYIIILKIKTQIRINITWNGLGFYFCDSDLRFGNML